MNTAPYKNIQKKAQQLAEEGFEFLKTSFHSAQVMTGKTVAATRLHYDRRKCQLDLYRTLHDLGKAAYDQLATANGRPMDPTPALLGLFGRVSELQQRIAQIDQELQHTTVINPPTPKRTKRPHVD
ncbi:MAG: hypothetical protein HY465_02440 [Deltaproteobacteria bacterium]|nr:hypothetical protein [Deltaproteobacteria bacterium]